MGAPLIEVYQPERRGDYWAAAARVRLRGGWVDIVARAPHELVARQMARLQALIAYHRTEPAMARGEGVDWIDRQGERQGSAPVAGVDGWEPPARPAYAPPWGDDVQGFWSSIKKGFKSVFKSKIFRSVAKMATSAIPFVGPTLAATGATDMMFGAASKLLGSATKGKGPKRAKARAKLQNVTKQAKAGKPQAQAAHRVLVAQAKIEQGGPKMVRASRGVMAAKVQMERAQGGDVFAQAQLQRILANAETGNEAAIEAMGYLHAAQALLDSAQAQWKEDLAAREPLEFQDEEDEDMDEDVGAAGDELVTQIRKLRAWRRLERKAAAMRTTPKKPAPKAPPPLPRKK